jgi:hypothetical protein
LLSRSAGKMRTWGIAAGAALLCLSCSAQDQAEMSHNHTALRGGDIEAINRLSHMVLTTLSERTGYSARMLGATKESCDWYLQKALTPYLDDCLGMAKAMLALTARENCQTQIRYTPGALQGICGNKCYGAMVKVLDTMSKAGCPPSSVQQTWCSQCPSGTECLNDVCRPTCSSTQPCACQDKCTNGICLPVEDPSMQRAEMGLAGYKTSLEYMCYKTPGASSYCLSDLYGVTDNLNLTTVCGKVQALGCCPASALNFVGNCALKSNESVALPGLGNITFKSLTDFCNTVDFNTLCPDAPKFAPGSCLATYSAGNDSAILFPGKPPKHNLSLI